ncbi:OstA organic solvent tolerance protein [Massilia sp. WF1]|uniref:LPS-assembly protein LptD n=1 Tax=unclassified Massilia TaxID=2609279 RepID=UPI000649B911|nr:MULTISPECIES: LPS-assembly protein LptD [unclassified Massilia]ALK99124.1 OstA organic solvent tolerance protein [Massilia sp. WG5]KLU35158.1 OstA organic solvent tolerance protein [Massilia sp. WF1]
MSWITALPFPPRRAAALSALVAVATGPLYAQTAPAASRGDDDQPTTMRAEEFTGRPDRELNMYRNVEVTRGATGITADTACFRQVEDEVTAQGHISMWRFGDRYKGDALQLNLETGKGWVLNPTYHLQTNNAQGKAARIDFLGENQAVVVDGTYSTCEGPDPDWYLKSSTLNLDSGRDVGTAGKTIIYFKDVPILGTPALSFSLSGARRSGWLPPSIGTGSKGAAEIMVPYYVNIAPNRDLTLYPRYIFNRGLQMGATGRYLGETSRGPYSGETHIEMLPNDRVAHRDRWWVDTLHNQVLAPGWSFGWNAHAASDDEYPSDFSRTVAASAERQLLRELRTDYSGHYWSLNVRAQSYQVLQDPASRDPNNPNAAALTVPRPYDRLPQINFHAGRFDVLGGFDWSADAELVRFSHPDGTLVQGNRANLVTQVSYPVVRPGWFVTPKLTLHATQYALENNVDPATKDPRNNISRVLPTASLDTGLIFERPTSLFGEGSTQTMEPRLFYVRTPFRDQSAVPNFDTAVAGFNYAQLFTENRFVGADKVSDANQLTAAVVSRFIESSGVERLRMVVGSRYYFSDPRVRLNNAETLNVTRSDALLAASGRISESWSFDSGVQYDAQSRSLYSQNYGVQWNPAPMKVLNLEYRFQRDTLGVASGFRNVDMSGQWPLSRRWYGVGRVSYSTRDRKLLESLIGLEYKADCWVFRLGAQRFVTALQTTSTPIFFQLELNGLSRLGFGNPLESFNKSIPGYTRLNTNIGRP